jgi:hypothetical protein
MVLPCEGHAPTMWMLTVTQLGTALRLITTISTPSLSSGSEAGSHGADTAEPGGRLLHGVDQGQGRTSAPGSGGHGSYDSHDGLNVPGLAAIRAAELVSCWCGLRLYYSLMAFTC